MLEASPRRCALRLHHRRTLQLGPIKLFGALVVVAAMQQGLVVDLDSTLALEAARLGLAHRLPLANSITLATARRRDAVLWTQDGDFQGLEGVQYFARRA